MVDQTIWLEPRAISFTAVCEECAEEHGTFAAHVSGRLELERGHTTTACARGHEIRVERANREPIGAF